MNEIKGKVESKKGFYIGDICYVLSDTIYSEFWGNMHGYEDGIFEVPGSEFKFAVAGTAYGDGIYYDEELNAYGVDAGVIGLVPIELVGKNGLHLGRVIKGEGVATFEAEKGKFYIRTPDGTSIYINTDDDDDEEEDCYYDDEFEVYY